MQEEKLELMEVLGVSDTLHHYVHHLLVHVDLSVEVKGVDKHCYSDRVIAQTNYEEVDELLLGDL